MKENNRLEDDRILTTYQCVDTILFLQNLNVVPGLKNLIALQRADTLTLSHYNNTYFFHYKIFHTFHLSVDAYIFIINSFHPLTLFGKIKYCTMHITYHSIHMHGHAYTLTRSRTEQTRSAVIDFQ